ncbi:unnamed protein product [Urochloa humidicola]
MADVDINAGDQQLERDHITSQIFDSEDEAVQFYESYALAKGFEVRKSSTKYDDDRVRISRTFLCYREGWHDDKYMDMNPEDLSRKPRSLTRTGCLAKLIVKRSRETGKWTVSKFVAEHDHDLSRPGHTCFLRGHRGITAAQMAEISSYEMAGLRKN